MSYSHNCQKFLLSNFPVFVVLLLYVIAYRTYLSIAAHALHPSEADDKLTIRVNTYRRLDLLEDFMKYYEKCDTVSQVQVVWSDQKNAAPLDWLQSKKFSSDKYIFEIHRNNSLSNRFRVLTPIKTEAVLSIDDDLIIPCSDLHHSMQVWKSNKRALVGFSPRMHTTDVNSGVLRYLNWQFTWWSGVYTIMLTKAALLHRDYLSEYDKVIPAAMLQHIDAVRNCEDIAMAYVVALKSNAAPVWAKATVYEVSTSGISSGFSHFIDRGTCLSTLKSLTTRWPWVAGYQKVVPFSWSDFWRLTYDTK